MEDWIPCICPFCRANLQIKAEYAHLRGRCPLCGIRIEPLRPKPAVPPPASTSDEPLGLLPLEEEWPEPPRVVGHDPRPHYGVASTPADWSGAPAAAEEPSCPAPIGFADDPWLTTGGVKPAKTAGTDTTPIQVAEEVQSVAPKKPAPSPAEVEYDIFGEAVIPDAVPVQGDSPPTTAQTRPGIDEAHLPSSALPGGEGEEGPNVTPYPFGDTVHSPPASAPAPAAVPSTPERPPLEPHSPYQLSDAELEPERPPPVPALRFFTGVWNFPFRSDNWLRWLYLSFGFMVLGGQTAILLALWEQGGMLSQIVAFLVLVGMFLVVIIAGAYAATLFITILQDTAAGNDEVTYPEGDWRMGIFNFLRLAWLTIIGLLLPGFLFYQIGCAGYGFFFILTPMLFSIVLLSSLASDSWFKIINGQVVEGLRKKPEVIPVVYFYSLVLLVLCAGTAFVGLVYTAVFIPVMGLVWSASWLTYARLLGRVGWTLTHDAPKKRKKKRKKKREEDEEEKEEDVHDDGQ